MNVPFADPPKTGFLTLEKIDLLIVQVETKEGVIGTGHLHPLSGGLKTLEMCIHEMLKPKWYQFPKINLKNLYENILPTKEKADLILKKNKDHKFKIK